MLGVFGNSLSLTTVAQSSPVLSVNPTFYQASALGQTVPIQVFVFAVSNVTGYQFQLRFNSTMLSCLNASVGNWFPGPPNSTSTVTVDNGQGIISIQAYLQGATPPLSVFGALHGTLLFANFNATYAPPYPHPDNNCPLAITGHVLYGIGNQTISHVVQNGTYVTPYAPPKLNLTLNTGNSKYHYEDRINVSGTFTGNGYPITYALAALEIQRPDGSPFVARTYTLSKGSFGCPLQITALTPCDSAGNPQNSFAVDDFAHFSVTVKNVGPFGLAGIVLVNPYDSSGASLGVSYFGIAVNPGNSATVILEFWLPYNTDPRVLTMPTSGNATVYASVWTNDIASGGTPLAEESNANFTITGTAQTNPTFPAQPPDGTYQALNWTVHFSKGLYFLIRPPNYTISVEAQYMGSAWTQNTSLTVSKQVQISIAGDINLDGKVGLIDLSILAAAYNTKPGDAKWNPAADINGDGKVGLVDLSFLAQNYGKGTV
jgi:hypothetical protein